MLTNWGLILLTAFVNFHNFTQVPTVAQIEDLGWKKVISHPAQIVRIDKGLRCHFFLFDENGREYDLACYSMEKELAYSTEGKIRVLKQTFKKGSEITSSGYWAATIDQTPRPQPSLNSGEII